MEGVRGKGQESTNQEHPRIVLLCESAEIWLCSYWRTGPKSSCLPPGPVSWWKPPSSGRAGEAPVQRHPSSNAALGSDLVCSASQFLGSTGPAGRQLRCPQTGAQQALASVLLSTLHFSWLLIHSIHLVLGVGQYVFWFSLFCIAGVFLGPRGCHLTGTLALHQASSPSSFPSKHPHASSSPPLLPCPWPSWTLAAFLTPLFSEPLPHLWLVCTPHNLRSLICLLHSQDSLPRPAPFGPCHSASTLTHACTALPYTHP